MLTLTCPVIWGKKAFQTWINKHICGTDLKNYLVNFARTNFQILNFISGKKCSSMENKHTMGKRARKIHQREMETRKSAHLFMPYFFIAFGNVLHRDNFVQSWSATWHDCCFLAPDVPHRTHEGRGAGQGKAAASGCEGSEPLISLSLCPLSTLRNSIHQANSSSRFTNGKLSEWTGDHVFRDPPQVADGLTGTVRRLRLCTDIGHLCLVLINFFTQKQHSLFHFFPPRILPLLPSLEYCGVLLFFFSSKALFLLQSRMNSAGCISGVSGIPGKPSPSQPHWWRCSLASLARENEQTLGLKYKLWDFLWPSG